MFEVLMKKIIFTGYIFFALSFLFGCLNTFAQSSNLQRPNIVTEFNSLIDIKKTKSIDVYLYYGNPTEEKSINPVESQLNIIGEGLVINKNEVYDMYYTAVSENDKTPLPNCNKSFTGQKYKINPSLITDQSFTYGLRSATDPENPSRTKIGNLPPKATGCIKVNLTVIDKANPGNLIEIIFNQNSSNSPSYQNSLKPGLQVVRLSISHSSLCSQGEEEVSGNCLPVCNNSIRDINGNCTDKKYISTNELLSNCYQTSCIPSVSDSGTKEDCKDCNFFDENQVWVNRIIFTSILIFMIICMILLLHLDRQKMVTKEIKTKV